VEIETFARRALQKGFKETVANNDERKHLQINGDYVIELLVSAVVLCFTISFHFLDLLVI
jgi:hypothetical protein